VISFLHEATLYKRMKIHELTYLVVDDLELMRAVTVNQLRALGCEKIKVARNGVAALEVLRAVKIDVVLCDWNMPVMSGLDLLKAIRADASLAAIPFLMITAEAERGRIEEVIHAGVSGLLVKPYNAGNLRNRLEKVLLDSQRPVLRLSPVHPTARPMAAPQARRRATDAPLAPSRILVVDTDPVTLKLLEQLFKDEYQVASANSGQSALDLCRAAPRPDLLLMAVKMPGMDGFEVVRQLHTRSETAQIPVIFVTDEENEDAKLKGMELGAVDFVLKSADPKALRARVRNFIKYIDIHRQVQADFDAMLEATMVREDVENTTRHDMKGSLAGIVGMVHDLARDPDMPPKHATQLRLVEQTAQQVMDMVNLSGELYKMEMGNFKLNPVAVNLGDILHRIVDVSRSTFSDKRLTVEVDTDTPVGTELPQALGDVNLCYSLFQNLVKNACEAAPSGSRVVVALRDENPLRVIVSNSGVVPRELRGNFFAKFATSGKQGGSGIGTYSAQLLAKAQNGDITMDTSDERNRTQLTVTLPRHVFDSATGTASVSTAH